MSKPVTHDNVEDVLSSILRLVSEDKRPLAERSRDPAVTRDPAMTFVTPKPPVSADRLVLTPALRVGDAAAAQDASASNAVPLDLGAVAKRTWPPQEDEDIAPAAPQDEGQFEPAEAPEGGMQDAADPDADAERAREMNAEFEARVDFETSVDLEASAGAAAADLSIRNTPPDPPATDRTETASGTPAQPAQASRDALFFEPAAPAERPVATSNTSLETAPLTAKIAALEAAIGEIANEWEPDGTEVEAIAARHVHAMAWEDDVSLDATGAPVADRAPDPVPDAEASEHGADTPEGEFQEPEVLAAELQEDKLQEDEVQKAEAQAGGAPQPDIAALAPTEQLTLDEEALRALVSEIVRAELQGALGERITRNVRKLVRREINRALTAQDME